MKLIIAGILAVFLTGCVDQDQAKKDAINFIRREFRFNKTCHMVLNKIDYSLIDISYRKNIDSFHCDGYKSHNGDVSYVKFNENGLNSIVIYINLLEKVL